MAWYRCGNGGGGGGTTILKGTTIPTSSQGDNGQIYLQHLSIPSGVDIRTSISNSVNGDYFDTGYKIKENTRIETKFNISGGATYPTPFGARYDTSGGNANQCFFALQNVSVYYAFGCSEVRTDNAFAYNTDTLIIAEKSGLKMYLGNSLKYISTNAFSQANTYNLFLFCANLAGSPWTASWAVMTLYYCKIYEGDDLIHYFLPCVDDDNEPCLYDVVTGDYLYNQGSGTLTVGSSITPANEIISSFAKVNGSWQQLIGTDISEIS